MISGGFTVSALRSSRKSGRLLKRSLAILPLALAAALLGAGCAKKSEPVTTNADTAQTVSSTTDSTTLTPKNITVPTDSFEVTVVELKAALDKGEDIFLLDVRTPEEYRQARVADANALIPYDVITQHLDELPADKDAYIYCICRSGRRSGIATTALREAGYKHTYNVTGGVITWAGAGYELISD